jgi:hypothetical protein
MLSPFISVDQFRILEHRIHRQPTIAVELAVKAALAPGMAGNAARLLDDEQHHVAVAIEADLAQCLAVPAVFALAP